MNIQDAIREANKGGDGRLKGTNWTFSIDDCGEVRFSFMENLKASVPNNIMSCDQWEVVTPDIEVGDVVQYDQVGGHYTVIAQDESKNCMLDPDGRLWMHEKTPRLTIIRKGAKNHVIDSVEFRIEKTFTKDNCGRGKVAAPYADEGRVFEQFTKGKKYTMTLTEEESQ